MPIKITQRLIDKARRNAAVTIGPQFLWDSEVQGFGVRVSPSGACSYVAQKWVGGRGGKSQRITLGHYPATNIDTARRQAATATGVVFDGGDLVGERKKRRWATREALNTGLKPTLELFLKRKGGSGNRYWRETERLLLTRFMPAIGENRPVASISKQEIRSIVEAKEEQHPGAARNLFASLRPFFKWCVERDLIPVSPMDKLTSPPTGAARDRILSEDEIKVFWRAAELMGYPFGPFYQLLLLTAQRREEVGAMRHAEIDLVRGEWVIPKTRTKNGKEHLVHLSPQAIALLQSCPRQGEFVFTTNGTTHISGYSKAKDRLDHLCALLSAGSSQEFSRPVFATEWRVHDLRRTAASGMAELGFQPHIVERVLNHISGAQGGLVGVYQRFEYAEERKRALEAWSNKVELIASGETAEGNVVSMKR